MAARKQQIAYFRTKTTCSELIKRPIPFANRDLVPIANLYWLAALATNMGFPCLNSFITVKFRAILVIETNAFNHNATHSF
jgi:hypothetical protein